jgi:hypothetical protein
MVFYLLPLAYFYLMFGLGYRVGRPSLGVALGSLPLLALALLRGQVGGDTPNYVSAVEVLRDAGEPLEMFEPLFERLLLALAQLPVDPMAVLALVSLLTAVLLLRGWWLVERDMVLFSGIFAVFFIDMTMNGLRYGLAFALIALAASLLVRGHRFFFWVIVAAASMIQISSGLIGIVLFLFQDFRGRSFVLVGLFAAAIAATFSDYLLLKLVANEVLQKPGALSGLSSLGMIGALLLVWGTDRNLRGGAAGKIVVLVLLALIGYGVAQISYAGLRLQALVAFLTALALACHMHTHGLRPGRRTVVALFVVGVLFGALKLRNIAQSDADAEAPFIPYKFFWEGV